MVQDQEDIIAIIIAITIITVSAIIFLGCYAPLDKSGPWIIERGNITDNMPQVTVLENGTLK